MVSAVLAVVLVGFLLIGGPFVYFGIVYLRRGVNGWQERRRFRAMDSTTVSAVDPGDLVKLVGTAEPEDSPGTGAFSGQPAVASTYEVLTHDTDDDGSGTYRRIHRDADAVPFRVVDATGSVVVDAAPDCVSAGDVHEWTLEVDAGESPPDRIREYLERTEGVSDQRGVGVGPVRLGSSRRKYRERSIRPGDDVVVVGRVERNPDAEWGDSLVVVPDPEMDGVLTNRSLDEISSSGLATVAFYVVLGTAMVLGPIGLLVAMLIELGTA